MTIDLQTDVDALDLTRVEEFAVTVGTHTATAKAGAVAYLGDRLGLWQALADGHRVDGDRLAHETGIHPRYAREWLATMAAVGYVAHDAESGEFHLPAEHAAVLAIEDSPAYFAPLFEANVGMFATIDRLVEAYRTGRGVAWAEFHPALTTGSGRFFETLYRASLVDAWLPALDGVVEQLERGARVLDVGCGIGPAVFALAEAYPRTSIRGVDVDPDSLSIASATAEARGLGDRVEFDWADAESDLGDGYDLVTFFDSFHHVADPVAVARQAKAALRPGGTLLLVEPRAGDRVEDNLGLAGITYYAASALVCVPDALAQGAHEALGGQAGPGRLIELLGSAGFEGARVAATADFNIVIEARA
ncbi:MAG TPA: class I SAM-dependent methyltransferase [Pedococcus sp.]|jgi:SAM-dependent methyltransferase